MVLWSCGSKISPNHLPSHARQLASGVSADMLWLVFTKHGAVHHRCTSPGLICLKDMGSEVLRFVQMNCAAMLFLEERLSAATLPNKPDLFHVFLILLSWPLTFNLPTEACGALGHFCPALYLICFFLWPAVSQMKTTNGPDEARGP